MTNTAETTTKLPTTFQINPGIGVENRVKLKVAIQTPYGEELITIKQGTTGTVTASTSELVKVKLDFHPLSQDSELAETIRNQGVNLSEHESPFYVEVLAEQIELIDPNIIIDPEFKAFITPLGSDERQKLVNNLLRDGCREPLVVWEGTNILLDGHNRFEICTKYGISYQIVQVRRLNRAWAFNWIISNQLGRRNLTPEAMSYLRGKLYNLEKQQGRRNDLTSGQSDQKLTGDNLTSGQSDQKLTGDNLTSGQSDQKLTGDNLTSGQNDQMLEKETAQRLAEQYKVGERTIRRDGKFAEAVDKLAETLGEEVRQGILSRDANLNKRKTIELAAIATQQPEEIIEQFDGGRYVEERKYRTFPYQEGDVVKLLTKNEPQLKGFRGCWAIIAKAYDFSGDLVMWNGTAQNIHPQYMQPLNYNQSQREQKRQLQQRIKGIIEKAPESMAMQVLSLYGRKSEAELTTLEQKMLALLEAEYGIEVGEDQETNVPEIEPVLLTETVIEESVSQETELTVETKTEIKKIIELPPIPEDTQPLHKVSAELDAKINNVNIPYNYLPSYQSNAMIDLIFEHTRSNGWNEEYENGFLRDIYGKNSWQEMTNAQLYHCLQLVRCYPAFYFPEDYLRECQVFAIGEQVMWMNQLYEVVGFLDDWTRVILVGIEEGNQGVRCYAHPCELKKLVKDKDE